MAENKTTWTVIIAPYSLEAGRVGEPVGEPKKMAFPSHVEALIRLGTLIFGAAHRVPQQIAGQGNGYRIYCLSPDGQELPFNQLYKVVEEFMGEEGRAVLKKTVEDIERDYRLFDVFEKNA